MLEQMRDAVSVAEVADIDQESISETNEQTEERQPAVEAEHDANNEPADFDDEQTVPLGKPKTQSPATGSTTSGNGGGRGTPPAGPYQPAASGRPMPPAGGPVRNFNQAPATPAQKQEYEPDYRVNPNATYLLVGGVVGYLIGRRRGRIKTEKRLGVVQRKLEKQVEAKQREINEKTETVQRLARKNYEQAKRTVETAERRPTESAFAERPVESLVPLPERPQTLREKSVAADHPETARVERVRPTAERQQGGPEKGIELSDADIDRLSETIKIGATNLRKIHEAKLITDGGLRRLVNEHLQGKDIRRGLAREFLTKELSYERDPRFRDIVPLEAKGARSQGGSTADQSVTQPASLTAPAFHPASPSHPAAVRKPIPVKQKRSSVSTGLVTVLSVVALALAAYAVWLGLMR
jgi:hypothetical protein